MPIIRSLSTAVAASGLGQAIKLRDWCIWLVDLFEYMMMHLLTNP
jgi:hypothetical protein